MRGPLLLGALLALGPPAALAQTAAAAVTALSPAKAAALLAATPEALVVDVRTPAEVAASGRLARALVLDVSAPDFEARALAALPAGVPVVLYCRSGRRAEAAAARLSVRRPGPLYTAGGFDALAAAGLATAPADP